MSRIDSLIAELCPDGVEFKVVGEIASYTRGVTYSKNDERPDGAIRVLRSNNITLSSNTINYDDVKTVADTVRVRDDQWLRANDILISAASGSKAHVGKVAYITEDIDYCFGGFMAVLRTQGGIESRFLFHLLIGSTFSDYLESALSTTTINNLNASIMNGFRIPIPPLEVQREIVTVLDAFTALEAELEAELEARRRQYQHYRDALLSFAEDADVRWATLGEVATFKYGFTAKAADSGEFRFIRITDITDSGKLSPVDAKYVDSIDGASEYLVQQGDVLMARTGATYGKTVLITDDMSAVYASYLIRIRLNEADILPSYYWHFAQSSFYWLQANSMVSTGGQPQFNANVLKDIRLSIPPLTEQARIVAILDQFDALVNDLTSGLPAEIAARRQQYAYYRDRLLSFQERT